MNGKTRIYGSANACGRVIQADKRPMKCRQDTMMGGQFEYAVPVEFSPQGFSENGISPRFPAARAQKIELRNVHTSGRSGQSEIEL